MTITTEEAERLAGICELWGMDNSAATIRSLAAERDALQARIGELEAALATARREGMEDAAKWHEVRSMAAIRAAAELHGKARVARNFRQLLSQSDFHMESAAAIRAALEGGKKDE